MEKENVIIEKPNHNPPVYDVNYYAVRNNAWEFLIKNNVNSYPLDFRKIAQNNNWQIWSYKKYCDVRNKSQAELVEKFPDGFTEFMDNSCIICYNQNNDKYRNRFTIAHEIGHIVLHKTYRGKKLEKEANMFAARILMPMLLLKELDVQSVEEVAQLFDVSPEAATFRFQRYKKLNMRDRFYTNPLEIKLHNNLKNFITKQKKK